MTKKHAPTDEDRKLVEKLAGLGVPQAEIGQLVQDGINQDTLRKYYRKELTVGQAKASSRVGEALFRKCMDGDTTALIWWTKTRLQWREYKPPKDKDANKTTITIVNSLPQDI